MRDFVQQQFSGNELRLSHRKLVELLRARRPAHGWELNSVDRSEPVARYVCNEVIDHIRQVRPWNKPHLFIY